MKDSDSFLSRLHEEKLATQARRGRLIVQKVAWVSGLVAAGSVRSWAGLNLRSDALLYVVPFVAIIFDIYIAGENYGIKRMGVFVRDHLKGTVDSEWEGFVSPKRDIFSWYALPFGSLLVLFVCAISLWFGKPDLSVPWFVPSLFWSWLVLVICIIGAMHFADGRRMRKLSTNAARLASNS